MGEVKIWEEEVVIPTYEVGEADRNPMFLEKRVYQGSSGKVYPYPTTEKICREKTVLSPTEIYEKQLAVDAAEEEICVSVYGEEQLLVSYQAEKKKAPKLAEPAEAAKRPEELRTNEELLLTGQHIEQHRHATYLPDPYYLEGLKRDEGDIRLNNAYGMLLLRRGDFEKSEQYFRRAIRRMTWRSPNPYNSEAYYDLGLALFFQNRKEEAFDAFYKATWSSEQQEMSFYYLAAIEAGRGHLEAALELVEKGLVKNSHNIKARGLKAMLLRKLGRAGAAEEWVARSLRIDGFDYVSRYEAVLLEKGSEMRRSEMKTLMRGFHESYLQTARDYGEAGDYEDAVAVLAEYEGEHPMILYYRGYYLEKLSHRKESLAFYQKADNCRPDWCFPNKLEDIEVLEAAIRSNPEGAKAYYYLGNLFYDKLQFEKTIALWETSIQRDDSYPTVHRNLALACYNKRKDPQKARQELDKESRFINVVSDVKRVEQRFGRHAAWGIGKIIGLTGQVGC